MRNWPGLSSLGSEAVPDEIVGHHLASAWDYRAQLGPRTDQLNELAARAARKLAAAGRLELSDVAAAASLLQRASDMLEPGDPQRVECLLSLAAERLELGEIEQAQQALRMSATAADRRQAILAEVLMCRSSMYLGQPVDDSEEIVREAVRRFRDWADDRGLAQAYLVQADLAGLRGQQARSAGLLELALKHGEAAGDAGCVAQARTLLGVTLLFGPTPAEQVIIVLEQMITSSGNDPRVRAEAEQVMCVMHAMCGRFEQARAIGADARQHLAEVGHRLYLANLAQSTGHVEELAGDREAAEREYQWSCASSARWGKLFSLDGRGHARPGAGPARVARASQGSAGVGPRHGSLDDVMTQSLIQQAEGLLAAAAGAADRARAAITAALRQDSSGEQPDDHGEACLIAADVEHILGNPRGEREHLLTAQPLFEAKGKVVRASDVTSRLRGLTTAGDPPNCPAGHAGPACPGPGRRTGLRARTGPRSPRRSGRCRRARPRRRSASPASPVCGPRPGPARPAVRPRGPAARCPAARQRWSP